MGCTWGMVSWPSSLSWLLTADMSLTLAVVPWAPPLVPQQPGLRPPHPHSPRSLFFNVAAIPISSLLEVSPHPQANLISKLNPNVKSFSDAYSPG